MNRGRYNFKNYGYGGRGRGGYRNDNAPLNDQARDQWEDRRDSNPVQRRGGANVGPPKYNGGGQKKEKSAGPPVPMHLSKVESVERNDPLFREAIFVEASQDLRPMSNSPEYFVGAEGFTELTLQVFDELRAKTPGFAKRVPLAVFRYYCAVILWQRMLKLQTKNGFRTTFDEQDFVRLIDDLGFEIPSPISTYLNGMGNTTMPSGREVLFRLRERTYVVSENELIGWFGQVTAQNHFLYRNYPCLAVFALNIMNCIRATNATVEQRPPFINWDLPADIQPVNPNHGLPSPNMLGYDQGEVYSQEQLRFLSNAGFTNNQYPVSDCEEIPVFTALLRAVQSEVNVTRSFRQESLNSNSSGSQAENMIVDVPLEEHVPAVYGKAVPLCLSKLTSVVAYLGAGMKYRTRHNVIRRRQNVTMPSSVYLFNNYQEVPVAWADSNNNMRTLEDQNYNNFEFSSVELSVRARIEKLIRCERVIDKT